jgi:hypothetical protein
MILILDAFVSLEDSLHAPKMRILRMIDVSLQSITVAIGQFPELLRKYETEHRFLLS